MANHGSARARFKRTIAALAATAGSLLGIAAAIAQQPPQLTVEVGRCVVLEAPDERFACYEAAVAAAKAQPRAAATTQTPASASASPVPPPAARVVELAGAPAAQTAVAAPKENDRRAERRREPEFEEFSSTIATLRETVPYAFLITLDNGQVWRQVQPKPYQLRTGQGVRLYSTGWRGSRLEADGVPGFIQVERVK
jgi:hypothetical protein